MYCTFLVYKNIKSVKRLYLFVNDDSLILSKYNRLNLRLVFYGLYLDIVVTEPYTPVLL